MMVKSSDIEIVFEYWGPFKICLVISAANPAQFHLMLAGLAVLISWQILNDSQNMNFTGIICRHH